MKKEEILNELKNAIFKTHDEVVEKTTFADTFLFGGEGYEKIVNEVWDNAQDFEVALGKAIEADLKKEADELIEQGYEYLEMKLINKFKEQLHLDSCYTD